MEIKAGLSFKIKWMRNWQMFPVYMGKSFGTEILS
jgi:hypothetical protein